MDKLLRILTGRLYWFQITMRYTKNKSVLMESRHQIGLYSKKDILNRRLLVKDIVDKNDFKNSFLHGCQINIEITSYVGWMKK